MLSRRELIGSFALSAGGLLLPKYVFASVNPDLLGTAVKDLPEGILESHTLEALPGKSP